MGVLHALWGQTLPQAHSLNIPAEDRQVLSAGRFPARRDALVPGALPGKRDSSPPSPHLGLLIAKVSLHPSAAFLLNKLDPNLLWASGYQVTGYYFSSLQHIACQSSH